MGSIGPASLKFNNGGSSFRAVLCCVGADLDRYGADVYGFARKNGRACYRFGSPDISSTNVNGVQMGPLGPTKDITAQPIDS